MNEGYIKMENIKDGRTLETAFIITDSSGEMTVGIATMIEQMFGGDDGSYFILSETTLEKRETGRRYKVLYVSDHNNVNHKVFFEIG
jgi:hypothetical protein|tara:strand:+ start:237 stop:497 length:261 start_codon:yes stop_codon:yes gene_type:complete